MEEKLIEAVRVRQVLYDTSHANYMRTKLKTEKWEEIAKEIGMKNGSEAKSLWEKLRHSLRDAIRRQQKCLKSGVPAEVIKEWKFQKQMGFLQPYMANKSREGNLREHSETENQTQDFETDVEVAELDNENIEQVNTQQSVENVEDESQSQTLPETVPTMLATTPKSLAPPRKKMKKDNVTMRKELKQERKIDKKCYRNYKRNKMIPYITFLWRCTILLKECHPHINTLLKIACSMKFHKPRANYWAFLTSNSLCMLSSRSSALSSSSPTTRLFILLQPIHPVADHQHQPVIIRIIHS